MSILIFSDRNDAATALVARWLLHQGKDFIRLNDHNLQELSVTIRDNAVSLRLGNLPSTIDKVWYRRGFLPVARNPVSEPDGLSLLESKIRDHTFEEIRTLQDYLYNKLLALDPNHLSTYKERNVNKLQVLEMAAGCGLNIPDTLVANTRAEVRRFLGQRKQCIVKSLSNNFWHADQSAVYSHHTEPITLADIEHTDRYVFPSLIQEYIDKKYDIRSFMLDGKIYSMAIFSQLSEKTKMDFRNYDNERSNRCIPFQLPPATEQALCELFQNLGLRTGSADLLYGKDKKFHFLEINPVGQFGMVSGPCNYYLEEKLAGFL